MNENINLCEILKECEKGTRLYCPLFGDCIFCGVREDMKSFEVVAATNTDNHFCFASGGMLYLSEGVECIIFPSREQRDWSKFKYPKTFDISTLMLFDRVLVRKNGDERWALDLFGYWDGINCICTAGCDWDYCIPYNEDTAKLLGTNFDCVGFYKWWEE